MFSSLRSTQSNQVDKPTTSNSGLKWFSRKTFRSLNQLIDNSLSTISEQIVKRASDNAYNSELEQVKRETLNNERTLGVNTQPAKPQPQNKDIEQLRKTLANHYQYKQNLPNLRQTEPNQNQSQRQYPEFNVKPPLRSRPNRNVKDE